MLGISGSFSLRCGGERFYGRNRRSTEVEPFGVRKVDPRLSGAAVTGSAAAGREDRWSDIDLAFGVSDSTLVGAVLSDFSDYMYAQGALHHHDLRAGPWIYRVFFLPGGLQVDLAFVEQDEFRPLGPAFKLAFGDTKSVQPFPNPHPKDMIGLAWLHDIHARR
jgi:hypothetical protein